MLSVEPWPRMLVASSVARVGVTWGRRQGAAFPLAGRWARCLSLLESGAESVLLMTREPASLHLPGARETVKPSTGPGTQGLEIARASGQSSILSGREEGQEAEEQPRGVPV